ncbi:membrane protein [Actinoplanes sp. OR16]|uniref:VIT1/CCC1 transporter family protein n=1 Tax=Actinoplanes sp. OR16 TaxID=946334 RepID=UPI000F6CDD11|nr:VIT1/CCC1 transporter family protein [Actinoplanes sp. OR16]BBH64306.1 membrane protein [Actinoplanes sp. OR16]
MTVPVEHHHADVSGGGLRAATFGAMDGLVTNIALIAGVGGATADLHTLILTGVAGLVAGAISMAIGEYTSVRTQNEQVAAELAKERHELRVNPNGEADELVAAWTARGLPYDLARQVADVLKDNPEQALRVHAQEELGVVPDELPSPWTAAFSSFVCFAVGALIPLLPLLFGYEPLWAALVVGGLGLFATGAVIARLTARPWWRGGLRQLLLGGAAAGATYVIGSYLGA